MNRFRSAKRVQVQQVMERGLPGMILIIIALVQIYLTQTANLSPWKGGGFGMFGAIDAPDMRVIQAQALDQDGQILQFDAYSGLEEETIRRLRTLPRQSDLEQIAPQFLDQLVVPTTIQQQALYQQFQLINPDFAAVQNLIPGHLETLPLPNLSHYPVSQPLYRLKTVYDPELPGAVKTLKAIRLQWWRIRFDQAHHRLWAEPLSPLVEAGVWQ